MLVHLVVALLQSTTPAPPKPQTVATVVERDSTERRQREKKAPKRVEVTAEHLATAFKNPGAKDLLLLARNARTTQDSALLSYDATTFQRVSLPG